MAKQLSRKGDSRGWKLHEMRREQKNLFRNSNLRDSKYLGEHGRYVQQAENYNMEYADYCGCNCARLV